MDDYYIVLIAYGVAVLIVCSVMGVISKKINESKGYYGGFAWGFWLGIIGIIVVACRAEAPKHTNTYEDSRLSEYAKEEEQKRLLKNGGWKCAFCSRVNPDYVTTCVCGKTPSESKIKIENENKPKPSTAEVELEEAKKLLEKNVITEEEYEAKRKKSSEYKEKNFLEFKQEKPLYAAFLCYIHSLCAIYT